jgi:hypothetical protein
MGVDSYSPLRIRQRWRLCGNVTCLCARSILLVVGKFAKEFDSDRPSPRVPMRPQTVLAAELPSLFKPIAGMGGLRNSAAWGPAARAVNQI